MQSAPYHIFGDDEETVLWRLREECRDLIDVEAADFQEFLQLGVIVDLCIG